MEKATDDNLLLQLFESYVYLVIEKYENKCLAAKVRELLTKIEHIENENKILVSYLINSMLSYN